MNEIIINEKKELSANIAESTSEGGLVQRVTYNQIDSDHFAFTCNPLEAVSLNMEESYYDSTENEFVDIEYTEEVEESYKEYYQLAAVSGVITGAIDFFDLGEKFTTITDQIKKVDWKEYVVQVARIIGYKKKDFNGAVQFILSRAVKDKVDDIQIDDLLKKCIHTLNMHPSYAGLIFAILTQFTKEIYSVTSDKRIVSASIPKYYAVGKNTEEKIFFGFLYWIFALVVDEVISKRNIISSVKIPNEIKNIIKEYIKIPFIDNIPSNYSEAEEMFSEFLRKTFQESQVLKNGENIPFNLSEEVYEVIANIEFGMGAVIINDCITRGVYVIKKLLFEIKVKEISSFKDIDRIDLENIIPFNNPIISKMSLISSGVFVGMNVAGAVLKAIKDKKANNREFGEAVLAEINIAGIGKFCIQCVVESRYWKDNIKIFFEKLKKKETDTSTGEPYLDLDKDIFKMFELNSAQARFLYSLENVYVKHDIKGTDKLEEKELKGKWLEEWQTIICNSMNVTSEEFFNNDEDSLYEWLFSAAKDRSNWDWFYLLTIELTLFKPYGALGSTYDKDYKKLKVKSDYLKSVFIRRQTVLTQEDLDNITKSYSRYESILKGNAQKVIKGLGITTVATLALSGAALAFAPQIAVLIAGEAVAGLHGAALVNASLAFVGGGSLAAGGLGMAGGTAIITGGGAMLGLAGSGSTSIITLMKQVPSEYFVRLSAKLLTFCNCISERRLEEKAFIPQIVEYMDKSAEKIKNTISDLEKEKNDLEKDNIENLKEYYKYLTRCTNELKKMIKG